ncbi:MAG: hypothetical protein M1823_004127 [Watsoniomyces obsoletus]|nr:MAG: hypothetical protein M1823_004127 [Watsoniomyces obsoletus]
MSTSSNHSRRGYGRVNSVQSNDGRLSRPASRLQPRPVPAQDAYTYALAAAYLSYLLQPRPRRLQHVAAPPVPQMGPRTNSSINDLMKDLTSVRDSKSHRLPHGFMVELEKRLSNIITGKDRRPEFQEPVVKRTFAVYYTAFTEQNYRRQMEKDRRVEDLVLIFFSNATKELQKGKPPGDDGWKRMVDRHVALFVRLLSATLREHDWGRDRPELTHRLSTLESKLLKHDQDLAATSQRAGGAGGTTIEVEVPRTYELKDMPLALIVANVFHVPHDKIQADLNRHRPVWTERAALTDLKTYQNLVNLYSKRVLRPDDFDLDEVYETWRKTEGTELSQMMLAILRSNPELAKSTPGGTVPSWSSDGSSVASDPGQAEALRKLSDNSNRTSSSVEEPVDLSELRLHDGGDHAPLEESFPSLTFIPPDPRAYYRAVLVQALKGDREEAALQSVDAPAHHAAPKLLSADSTKLLQELATRWRIPASSRQVLFLDVVKDQFLEQEIDLDALDAAFEQLNEVPQENRRASAGSLSALAPFADRAHWTIADFALARRALSSLHDALLRDLYDALQHCYEAKPPSIGPVMYVLEQHIRGDPAFSVGPDEEERFADQLGEGLRQKALEVYSEHLHQELPNDPEEWEFYHVIQLGKTVLKLAERIQKRYKKNPEIMGVNPLTILLETVLPAYETDMHQVVHDIIAMAQARQKEVAIEDGFELYKELVEIRRVHRDALPSSVPFTFNVEDELADFVWRWIRMTDGMMVGWVEQAVKHDLFSVRPGPPDDTPSDDDRHSPSIVDVFRSFNQSIDQILQLHWADELQHAKFMTAISKAVGGGLARYCEILEQRFTREMDRLTPEQEAAANRGRQEKWMQLAKEAWANKEKIEPFQFYPQSLVKLNNVEWAIQQLDRLEHKINVDACAEVVQRHAPPITQRDRTPSKYVFTIKIVEAEDLKACDMNGYSDPYVVLGDEYQKRLAKTRIIYANLNPRWDESVDITTQGPLNIIATVWDWDVMGDHDCVGRTSLKLDPSHFSDYRPREYWLDLDTQGRLLLRVSMEGERDDIQFYFGKAFRTLKRTERDMTRIITDKLSSYINHCLSRVTLKSLLNRGISIASVSTLFARNARPSLPSAPSEVDVTNALRPLFQYFNDNFAIMKETLTSAAMVMVMTRLWKEVLATIEALLVPPLSDKPSQQRPLTQQELDIVFKWLQLLFDFFHAVDEETGISEGVPMDVLKSPKYHEIQSLNFFYFESTESLIRTSERMASATANRQLQQRNNRLSAPGALGGGGGGGSPNGMAGLGGLNFGGAAGLLGMTSTRRTKSIMLSRNLGTMRKAKEEKRREAQAEPNDDIILRILRMRPEATGYLRNRSRQKERLAAAAAAELIVKQSLAAAGGRSSPRV